jgi:cytochrome P450
MLVPIPAAADYTQAKKASDAVVAMLAELVEARQAAPADDLVSGLISARDRPARP